MDELTDPIFWQTYWRHHPGLNCTISKNYIFSDIFQKVCRRYRVRRAIELGGFPGFYAIYLKKFLRVDHVALLDRFFDMDILERLWQKNNILPGQIQCIQTDLFSYEPKVLFDLVFSVGLIEHFTQPRLIVEQHIKFLSSKGVLMLVLPNFRGLNGWIQQRFDPWNYQRHNIACMSRGYLVSLCKSLGLDVLDCQYYMSFGIWLEPYPPKPLWQRLLVRALWLPGKVWSKLLPIKSRWFSPYIVLLAQRIT